MSKLGMIRTVLATGLSAALKKDGVTHEGKLPHVNQWMRGIAQYIMTAEAKAEGFKRYDVVSIVTSRYQSEENMATILRMTTFEGEEAALVRFHEVECKPQQICTRYMTKVAR